MTKNSVLVASVALLVSFGSFGVQARSLSEIRGAGVLRVGTSNLPPFAFKVPKAGYIGAEADLINLVASQLKLKVEFVLVQQDTAVNDLNSGKIDVMIGAQPITSTRVRFADFTQPYLCMGMSVASRDPAIRTHLDLKNRSIGVMAGSIEQSYVHKLPFAKQTKVYADVEQMRSAFTSNQFDASLTYKAVEPGLAKLYPKLKLHFGPVQWTVPLGAMLPLHSGELRQLLNDKFSSALSDGRFAQISRNYFGSDQRCKS